MRRTLALAVAAAVLAAFSARDAGAASLAIEARAGYEDFTSAPNSSKAVFDHRGGITGGLGLRADLGRRFFLRLAGSYVKQSGDRVFVADAASPVFHLGHPLEMKLMPVFLDAAYRFPTGSRLHPYVGVGAGLASYKETSTVAGLDLGVDRSKVAGRAFLGSTWGRGHVQIGAEASYALMPNTLGSDAFSAVSRVYGETDIGGLSGVATLTLRP